MEGVVDLDISKFIAGATAVSQKLDSLTRDVLELDAAISAVDGSSIDIDVDVDNALHDFAALEAQIDALDGRKIGIDVDVDKEFYSIDDAAGSAARSISGSSGGGSARGGLIGSLVLLGTTLLPLTPLVLGVAGAMASSFAVAGAAAGAFAVFAIPTFQKVTEGVKGLKSAQDKLASAKSADEIQEAQKELTDLTKKLRSEGLLPAIKSLNKFKDTYDDLVKKFQEPALEIFTRGLGIAEIGLRKIFPVAEKAAQGIEILLIKARQGLKGDSWGKFFQYLKENAAGFILTWGLAVGNFITGIANMIVAFDPLTQNFNRGLRSMSERFLEWSKTLDENESFQNFINYVLTEGPKAWAGVKALAKILVDLGKALAPIGEIILDFIVDFSMWVDEMKNAHPEAFKLGTQIAFLVAVLAPIASFLQPIAGAFMFLARGIAGVTGAAVPLVAIAAIVGAGLFWLGRKSEEAGIFFDKLRVIWDQLKAAAQRVVAFMKPLIEHLQKEVAPEFIDGLNKLLSIFSSLIPVIEFVAKVLGVVLVFAIETVVNIFNGIMTTIQGVIQFFQGLIQFVMGVFTGNWGKAWKGIKRMAQGIWNVIKGLFKVFMNLGILKVGRIALNLLKGVFKGAWNAIKGLTSKVWNGIKNVIRSVWNGIKSFVRSGISTVKSIISGAWNAIKGWTRSAFNSVKNFIKNGIQRGKDAVRNGISKIKGFFSDLPGKIKGALGNLGSLLWNAGSSIIGGLLNGIKSKFEDVKNFVGGIGSWISDHKGPKQYDMNLLKPHGGWIMKGLDEGMAKGLIPVLKTASGIAGSIQQQMNDVTMGASGNIGLGGVVRPAPQNGPAFRPSDRQRVEVTSTVKVAPGGDKLLAALFNRMLRDGYLNIETEAVKKQ